MKVNLKRLEKIAYTPKDWLDNDYMMAHFHLIEHMGWELTKKSALWWDVIPIRNEHTHLLMVYINPRTKGCYGVREAIKYLVETMNVGT